MSKEYQANNIEYIEDDAVVTAVNRQRGIVTVRLVDSGECGGCPAARICSLSSGDSRTADIMTDRADMYSVGMPVIIRGTERLHRKAIMLATVLPCIALIAVMVAVYLLTASQLAAALSGAGACALVYVVLYLMRNKIAHEFNFSIQPREDK